MKRWGWQVTSKYVRRIIQKKDVAFYTSSRIKHYSADAGSFFLFFPSDIHQPSVRGKGELVKSRKIVIKIEYVD
ncbi:YhcH/YjgK/YiaL family protein [Bacteroides uniformis]|uniref:YhcH/YjgK/YiaL family protein n=1 Tax=Bacteroides uniformis TaxID=820 RepID=UPI0021D2A597|nr:YhcH/YjgK/YiaL family protein [Bacteroides uniformis]